MVERIVVSRTSLEARAAAMFVQTASKFASSIKLKMENRVANAKSIMGIISLSILEGQEVTITAEGDDAERAVSDLSGLLTGEVNG